MHTNSNIKNNPSDDSFWENFEVPGPSDLPEDIQLSEDISLPDTTNDTLEADTTPEVSKGRRQIPTSRTSRTTDTTGTSNRKNRRIQGSRKSNSQKVTTAIKSASRQGGKAIKGSGKVLKETGKTTGKLINKVCHGATEVIILILIAVLSISFWKDHSNLGNPASILQDRNFALAAYLAVAAFLLLFEVIALFRSLSTQKIWEKGRKKRLDTGRGLTSFLLLYAGAYVSYFGSTYLPGSPEWLSGLRQAVILYGSLHKTLFILCLLGAISCILRWLTSRFSLF